MTTKTPTIKLPPLRSDQYEVAMHPARFKVVCCGRRWGKTFMGGTIAVTAAASGGRVAWVAPIYRNGKPLFEFAVNAVAHLRKFGVKIRLSERTITFPNGGFLAIYSGDSADAMRGDHFDLVILDEASRMERQVFFNVVRPTLADTRGSALFLSTPFGNNWFKEIFFTGRNPDEKDWQSWHYPTSANPIASIREEFEEARKHSTEREFREEWLAEFLDDAGVVFRNVDQVCTATVETPYPGAFVMGVDWGRHDDYTVITVFDVERRRMVDMTKFTEIGWDIQRSRLKSMYYKWNPLQIHAEENSFGGPQIEQLRNEGLPMIPFKTTGTSKGPLINYLALCLEQESVTLLNDEGLKQELKVYQMERTASGNFKYSAPSGFHDDMVIATALSTHGLRYATAVTIASWSDE